MEKSPRAISSHPPADILSFLSSSTHTIPLL